MVAEERFHESTVQLAAYQKLQMGDSIKVLKESLIVNGFLQYERIVVRPYEKPKPKKKIELPKNSSEDESKNGLNRQLSVILAIKPEFSSYVGYGSDP